MLWLHYATDSCYPYFFTHPDIPLFPDLDFPPSLFELSGTNVHIDM